MTPTSKDTAVTEPATPPEPDPGMPYNVIGALAAVMREAPSIGKDSKSPQGYNYRGIEAITAGIQPLLGKYGVVFVPRVIARTCIDIMVNSKPWTEEQLTVEYTVYGPRGVNDCITVGPIVALGRDNSDKGTNKAMTQAFKYALLQTLCIGDAKDDADSHKAAESDARHDAPPVEPPSNSAVLAARIKGNPQDPDNFPGLGNAAVEAFGPFCDAAGINRVPKNWTTADQALITAWADTVERDGYVARDLADLQSVADEATFDLIHARIVGLPSPPTSNDTAGQPDPNESPVDAQTAAEPPTPAGDPVEAPESPAPAVSSESTATPATDIAAQVKAMPLKQVRDELAARTLDASGTPDELRKALAVALAREALAERATRQ